MKINKNLDFHTDVGWFGGVETNEIAWKWRNSENRLRKITKKIFFIKEMTENTKKICFWLKIDFYYTKMKPRTSGIQFWPPKPVKYQKPTKTIALKGPKRIVK